MEGEREKRLALQGARADQPSATGDDEFKVSRAIHRLAWSLARYRYPPPPSGLPENGIYLMFEDTEITSEGPRIVRVGIHRGQGRLRRRLAYHVADRRGSSVFRRHVGRALLNRAGADPDEIARWCDRTKPMPEWEERTTAYISGNVSYCCIRVDDLAERAALEKWLIGTLSAQPLAAPSTEWLGRSADEAISKSGLWNKQHVWPTGSRVDPTPLARLSELAAPDRVAPAEAVSVLREGGMQQNRER
jgi:hypothetical protein